MFERREWVHVIPATPGYFLVSLCFNEDGVVEVYVGEPVLAWRVDSTREAGPHAEVTSYAVPVTFDLEDPSPAILCPDGRVMIPCDETFESLDEYRNNKLQQLYRDNEELALAAERKTE